MKKWTFFFYIILIIPTQNQQTNRILQNAPKLFLWIYKKKKKKKKNYYFNLYSPETHAIDRSAVFQVRSCPKSGGEPQSSFDLPANKKSPHDSGSTRTLNISPLPPYLCAQTTNYIIWILASADSANPVYLGGLYSAGVWPVRWGTVPQWPT